MNPYDAKRAYTESAVLTAPPERLVVMLYDGAIRFLNQAAVAMRAENRRVFLDRVQRGEAIITELNLTLDMRQGEVAERLRAIYQFCNMHLAAATMERDPAQGRRRHPPARRAARGVAADRRRPARRRRRRA